VSESTAASVASVDALPAHEAAVLFASCCGSTAWVQGMVARRPFQTLTVLLREAEDLWWSLSPDDWREAFDHHPRIGEQRAAVSQSAQASTWSAGEQRGVADAATNVREALVDGNREYERRFGHIYLVCATGKSAEEMLALLRERLGNDPATELRVAAGEQARITRLRLLKMFDTSTDVPPMISTHVLDTARGCPAAGVPVLLEQLAPEGSGESRELGRTVTDTDGRVRNLMGSTALGTGTYRLTFDTASYFSAIGVGTFYPAVSVVFAITDASQHYHVPLLLSPFGYSTYRGS
jgi:2-oxo-4-hydroxy-4-carboxy-5-ureidoimidazoline decarboxylase